MIRWGRGEVASLDGGKGKIGLCVLVVFYIEWEISVVGNDQHFWDYLWEFVLTYWVNDLGIFLF